MKDFFKNLVLKIQGFDPTIGEPIDLTYGGGARAQSTVNPDQALNYNEFWERIYEMNKAAMLDNK